MADERPKNKTKNLPLNLIRESEVALRKVNTKSEKYENLVESVRRNGVLNPIVVREVRGENGITYGLVDGLHRFTAAKHAGLEEIPANIVSLGDAEVMEAQVIGNVQRVETKPVEYAQQLRRIFMQNPTMTINDMATRLSKSPAWVSQRLKLVDLPDNVKPLVDDGKITLANAYALVELAKQVPDEVDNYLTDAQTMPPGDFSHKVNGRVKQAREARRAGRDPNASKEFRAEPWPQKSTDLKDEYNNFKAGPKVLEATGAKTAEDGWKAALAWANRMDPISVEENRRKFEAEKAAAEEAKAKRKAERDEKAKKAAEVEAAAAATA
jgi:ParB/RepB/Spo0J family partition protein